MPTSRRVLLVVLAALLLMPAAAQAHTGGGAPTGGYQWGRAFASPFTPAMKAVDESRFEKGPCTDAAAGSMPVGEEHDHLDVTQHRFSCRMEQVAFDSLEKTFGDRPERVLGEMDVKGNLAVVAVAYPHSGFLLYDISDAAAPKLLSFYGKNREEGNECEGVVLDVDCGAFVDLSPDLKRVYISVQQISVLPGASAGLKPDQAFPGVEVIDISDPKSPSLIQKLPVESVGGVHTTRSFDVPKGPSSADAPREPGSYTVSVANSVGATISRVNALGLEPLTTIELEELHDTFIQQDPMTGRTLLYIAGGFDTGFYVYDVTAPSEPKLLAEWDLTPECESDWYSHTIDVTTRNGKRFVTLPVELIDFFGDQSKEDQAEGCGKLQGNGDMSGPLWIVDATDFSKLGPAEPAGNGRSQPTADNDALKKASETALTATWSNAANRAGGELTFSPHNQQIVGDRIYLSGYHSGVTVLDASAAFRGENVRPKELAFHVPSAEPTRPIHPPRGGATPLFGRFFTSFLEYRPLIWDMTFVNGHVLASDMVGGFYSLRVRDEDPLVPAEPAKPGSGPGSGSAPGSRPATQEPRPPAPPATPAPPAPVAAACTDRDAPISRFSRVRVTRKAIDVRGRSADRGCAKVARVVVAVGRQVRRHRCRFLKANGRFSAVRRCAKPIYQRATGTASWSLKRRARLSRGSYLVFVRGTDAAGNRERAEIRVNGRRLRVR